MSRTVAALIFFAIVARPGDTRATPAKTWLGSARLVVLSTRGNRTSPLEVDVKRAAGGPLVVAAPRAFSIAPPIVHLVGGFVRGALAGDDVLVVAEEQAGRFSSALWRVSRTDGTRVLDTAYAARPLVVGRRAYVTIGRAGFDRQDGSAREDELAVTELDLDGGTIRTVAQLVGQLATPLAVDDDAGLLVYAVTPHAPGNVLAFDLRGGPPRDLGTIGPARDFSFLPRIRAGERRLGPSVVYTASHGLSALTLEGERVPLLPGDAPVDRALTSTARGVAFRLPDGTDGVVPAPTDSTLTPVDWLVRP